MATHTLRRLRMLACALGLLVAAGCGGGGGSDTPAEDPPPAPPVTPPQGVIGTGRWLQPSVTFKRDIFASSTREEVSASLSIRAVGANYWFRYSFDQTLVDVSHTFRTSDEGIDFNVAFHSLPERAPGSYNTTLSVMICYDDACARPAPGSPYTLPLQLDVGYHAQAEVGIAPWTPAQTAVLNHDVVGAAYSAALDAVITASALPSPQVRVHELRTGIVRSIALLTAPSSLSVGADGLQAAVGQDAAVSLVDLRANTTDPVRRLSVPVPVGAVALAGTRIVAVGVQAFGWNEVYWVNTVTGGAEKAGLPGFAWIYGIPDVALHPTGNRVYFANRDSSPDDVLRMDMGGDASAARVVDSRYHGDYPFCGRVAASPDGRRLYTGCGVVLSSSPLLDEDMLYAGQISLSSSSTSAYGPFVAAAVSVASDSASVALLEHDRFTCAARSSHLSDCHTRLAMYDATTLARRSLVSLPPYIRGNDSLKQWGRYLMHRADGSLVVVAEARTRGEATPTWLLHRVNP